MPELTDQERVARLTARLGLPERSLKPELALQALRHGSYVHERSLAPGREILASNERLEFLGDAVLGFLIARLVYERHADALEAVLAAVVLSCGLEQTQDVLDRLLAPLLGGTRARDAKTELQQLFQSRRRTPQYQVLSVAGPDHARSYEVEVRLDAAPLGRGTGRSKKEAEQAAALAALQSPQTLERALLDEPVSLALHDPRWGEQAAEEAAKLRAALPDARVEHFGSTAVPGLAAKPVIDLLVGVRELSSALRLPDYEAFGEAGVPGRLYFRKRGPVSFNAHIVQYPSDQWQERLLFRDYLRAHPEERERYGARKLAAIASGAITLLRYSEEKAGAVEQLLERARRWSAGAEGAARQQAE